MLKAVRQKRKAKEVISDNFTISNTNFKPCSITLSNKQLFTNVLNRINDLGGVPSVNECFHIVTKSQINSFDFILLFLATNKIDTLTIAFYRIGKKIVQELKDLHDKGQIRKINLLVNDGGPKLCPDVYNLIKQYEKDTFQVKIANTHTKIICLETDEKKYFVIEGSGNMSQNSKIEQYLFTQNKALYDFHLDWISKI